MTCFIQCQKRAKSWKFIETHSASTHVRERLIHPVQNWITTSNTKVLTSENFSTQLSKNITYETHYITSWQNHLLTRDCYCLHTVNSLFNFHCTFFNFKFMAHLPSCGMRILRGVASGDTWIITYRRDDATGSISCTKPNMMVRIHFLPPRYMRNLFY